MHCYGVLLLALGALAFCTVYVDAYSCPRICPQTSGGDPVCGTDGVIYTSICELKKKTCGKGVKVDTNTRACLRSEGSNCEHRCGKERDPVCGTDGRTYLNRCMLQVEVCRVGVSLSHVGPCNNISAHRENCPVNCHQAPNDGPICGSDSNVYKNTCVMKLLTCGQGVVRTSKKYCQTTRHCREACWKASKPICSSDGQIYANSCRMKAANCGKHVFEVPMSFCVPHKRNALGSGCPISCEGEKNSLTCGSDGNIYFNECEMKMLNCGAHAKRVITKVDFTKCKSKFTKCNKLKCSEEYDPVCGTDAKTYRNKCKMQIAACLRGIQLAHNGNCTSVVEADVCPEACPTSEEPVCGSDGNVYRSECIMRRDTCGQKVVRVAAHHCKTTALCEEECGDERQFVCGSDNKIYRNECQMRKANCGKHVFVMPLKSCLTGFKFRGCQKICPAFYDPICGTDGKTYSNECFLGIENCRSRRLVTKRYLGQCGKPIKDSKNYLY